MKGKTILLVMITALCACAAGWFLHSNIQTDNQANNRQVNGSMIDRVSQMDTIRSNHFAGRISGRFILTGANCAGFNFIGNGRVLWTNEIFCNDPDTLDLRWLSDSIFLTKSILRVNEACPPRVDIYKIISFNKGRLQLKAPWTGWGNLKDDNLVLIKETGNKD